jgi:hypothetical protein
MEQEFEYEMNSLSKRHASELSAIDLKAKGKVHTCVYVYMYVNVYTHIDMYMYTYKPLI